MRNLYNLINRMLEVIPEREIELINELIKKRVSVSYAAPEMIPTWFREVQMTLDNYVFADLKENYTIFGWREDVRKIWTGEE